MRKIVKPKSKAQQEEEAAVSLATVVWDMTDRCAHRHTSTLHVICFLATLQPEKLLCKATVSSVAIAEWALKWSKWPSECLLWLSYF